MSWFAKYGSMIAALSGAAIEILTRLGLMDWVPPLQRVDTALTAGDPVATLTAVVAFLLFIVHALSKHGANVAHEESVQIAAQAQGKSVKALRADVKASEEKAS